MRAATLAAVKYADEEVPSEKRPDMYVHIENKYHKRFNREHKAKFNAQTVTVRSLGIVRGSGQSAEWEMSLASHDDFPPSSYRFHYAPCPKDPTCT